MSQPVLLEKARLEKEANQPHVVSEVVCLKCLRRWIAVRPEKTLLRQLECRCGAVGFAIETGEILRSPEGESDG